MVHKSTYTVGLNRVLANLNREIQKIEGRSLKGMIMAAIDVRRDMDKVAPKIPVDLNNLRSSFFMVTSEGKIEQGESPAFNQKRGKSTISANTLSKLTTGHSSALSSAKARSIASKSKGPSVVLGFSAFYAIYVHEMIGSGSAPLSKRALKSMRPGIGGIRWNRKGSGPKFFENALDRNTSNILYKIGKEAKIG